MTETLVGEPDPQRKICAVCEIDLAPGVKCPDHNQFGVPAGEFYEALKNLNASRHRKLLPNPTTHVMRQDPQSF